MEKRGEHLPYPRPKRSRKLALLEGAIAGALFGTAAIFINLLRAGGIKDGFSIAFWRLVIASLILTIVVFASIRRFNWSLLRKDIRRISLLGVLIGLHFILFVSAVLDTTIINATVLVNTTPIWSMFVSSLIFKLKPSRLAVFGIALSLLGVFIITYGHAASLIWTVQLKGDLEAVVAAVVEAFYLSYGRETRQKMPLLPLMLTIYVFAAITVLVTGVAASSTFAFPLELSMVLALIGLGVLPTAMAHSFYFSSLSNLKSFETATMALLEPIGATILGIVIFAQIPNPIFILGAVLVLTGIISVAIKE
jgi:drug/metabolite transporter (DMT)-like permease